MVMGNFCGANCERLEKSELVPGPDFFIIVSAIEALKDHQWKMSRFPFCRSNQFDIVISFE